MSLQYILSSDGLETAAVFSTDGSYRYFLARRWSPQGKTIAFICLNPSTADAVSDDPTIRRCISFAKNWGGAKLLMGNLFAYRSTDPKNLMQIAEPIGTENDVWLNRIVKVADIVVAGWGTRGALYQRNIAVLEKFKHNLNVLRLTKDGHPSHPLYLPSHLAPYKL